MRYLKPARSIATLKHPTTSPKTLLLPCLLCTVSSLITNKHITMKFSLVLLSVVAATSSAFVAQQPVAFRSTSVATLTQLQAKAAAAKSKEEDIELTRKLILAFMDGDEAPAEEPTAAKATKAAKAAPAPADDE
jgi:hypothetical protein